MKNIYSLIIITVFLNSCSNKKEPSLEEILATNDVELLKSRKSEIDAKLEELTLSLNQLNNKLSVLNKDRNTPLITTITTSEQKFNHFIELQGNVKTKQNVLVYPEMPGILNKVYVKEGQKVIKDDILATIDDGGKRVSQDDGFFTIGPGRDNIDGGTNQFFEAGNISPRSLWQSIK